MEAEFLGGRTIQLKVPRIRTFILYSKRKGRFALLGAHVVMIPDRLRNKFNRCHFNCCRDWRALGFTLVPAGRATCRFPFRRRNSFLLLVLGKSASGAVNRTAAARRRRA